MIESTKRGPNHPPTGSRSLRPTDFSFQDFGELRLDELRKISMLRIRSDPPTASIVKDAIFIPNGDAPLSDHATAIGGIVKSDGLPIETAKLQRKGGKQFGGPIEEVTVRARHELDEDVVYLGPLFNHYGRVLLESLSRVWYLSE